MILIYFIILQVLLCIPLFYTIKKQVYSLTNSYIVLKSILTTLVFSIILTLIFSQVNKSIISPIWRSKSFSKYEWSQDPSSRYRMVNDLIKGKKLIHKSKAQIIEMLGSDFTSCLPNSICYWAQDPTVFLLLDDFKLIIHFDKNGKALKVEYFPI